MVDFVVTVLAYSNCLASLGYHHSFPMLLAFEVLHFVDVVNFKGNVRLVAQFAYFSGQAFIKSSVV